MRLLKLATSDEVTGPIPPEQRAGMISARLLSEALGEPCELESRVIWPNERLPALLDRWLDEIEPDLVLFVVNAFWVSYKSTPLLLQRRFGRPGKVLAYTGIRAAQIPWLAYTPPFKLARRAALRAIGAAYYFEPDDIVETAATCLRRVLAKEGTVPVVRGPLRALTHHGTRKDADEAEERTAAIDQALRELCARLHVEYTGAADWDAAMLSDDRRFLRDNVHTDVEAHRIRGTLEAEALLRAWRTANEGSSSAGVAAKR